MKEKKRRNMRRRKMSGASERKRSLSWGGVVGVSGRGEKIDDKGEGKGAGENRWSVRWSC